MDLAERALIAVNNIPAMVAYWDAKERCQFSNEAYREWFGRGREDLVNLSLEEVLGPTLYRKNRKHIRGVLRGEKQIFERKSRLPGGVTRTWIATYVPDLVDGVVRGFWAHVADTTLLSDREAALQTTIAERDKALAEIRTLRGLLPICSYCKRIRDEEQVWHRLEAYLTAHTDADFSHGICPDCLESHFGSDTLASLTR